MILVDSSVWIDYFNGNRTWQTNLLDNLLSDIPIIIGDLILAEILQGFRSDNDYESAKSYLSDLPFRQMGGYQVAVQSAQEKRGDGTQNDRCYHRHLLHYRGASIIA
jgi:hypothetical protein